MSSRARIGLVLVIASCSIKDVDLTGKACPCPDGWVCATDNTCRRSANPTDDAPAGEGLSIDTILPPTSCLTAPFPTVKYSTDFSDFAAAWKSSGGTWVTAPGTLAQTDKVTDFAYAWHSAMAGVPPQNYRVVATMHQSVGAVGGALEIAFRINDTTQSMYHCNYEPNDGLFMIQHTDNGIAGSTLQEVQLDSVGDATFTMEVQVNGTQLECCLDNVTGAHITLTSSLYATGTAGLKTYRMAGAFTSFTMLQ